MSVKTIHNNKATIVIGKETVRKTYFESERNIKEYKTLKSIYDSFEPFNREGWRYEFVQVLEGTKEGGILMNRVKDGAMIDDPNFGEMNYYHAGLWLGYFHSLSLKNDKVKTFYDFTISNLFISYKENLVTGMDPGDGALQSKNYYFDILKFFYSAIVSKIKRKTLYNKKCVESFIRGYRVFGEFKFRADLFNQSSNAVFKDSRNSSRIKNYGRIKFYSGYILVWVFVNGHLKRILKSC